MDNCITIGMDLGDKKHAIVGLDAKANIVLRRWLPNDQDSLRTFFERNKGAEIGMETGTHCRWISVLATECGCKAYIGNAHKLRSIFGNTHKNDMRDAEEIANLLHENKRHFHPVMLRDQEHQDLVQLVKMREVAMTDRTRSINAIRGMAKANGARIADCDADSFHRQLKLVLMTLPDNLIRLFRPQIELLKAINATIKAYGKLIDRYRKQHFKEECALLETIPGIGPINSTSFVAFAGDVKRFRHACDVGPYFGLTAGRDQSSDKDEPKKITKEGNKFVRHLLVNAANNIMKASAANTELKQFALRVWGERGKIAKRKAKVALARKLAVTMAAMLRNGTAYRGIIEEPPLDGQECANEKGE